MFLSSISLRNIRKHTNIQIDFTDKLNYLVGGNGVGKTTILESIYYLCTTKSSIASSDSEVVKMGENSFTIKGHFAGLTNDLVQIDYSQNNNKKNYILSNKQAARLSDIIGKFPVVLLSPADHSITQGYPAERRRFVDSVISQASRTYLNNLIEYNRTLKQRTSLLYRLREHNSKDFRELSAWNKKLVASGVEIMGQHKTFQTVLRFAEFFYLKDKTGTLPIFLLDDVFGELDAERAAAISNYLSTVGQAIFTLTDFGNISFLKKGKEDRVINISAEGSVAYA
ncbi:MAG: recF [Ignavibacteriaceae bacterium]|nr:recF [Ignavibacteriaceae bacterium]